MKRIKSLVACAVFALSTAAAADTITVTWAGPIFSPLGSVDVGTVTFPGGSTGTNAGRFRGSVTATTGIDPAELIDANPNFFAYCHDLAQTIGSTTTYTVNYGASAVMLDFLGAVNAVLGGDPFAWLHPADVNTSAAIQLGIWEALHNDNFILTSGGVRFSSVPVAVANLFTSFVNARAGSADLDSSLVMTLTSPYKQDVITGRNPPGQLIPEPATLVLLGVAAVAAGLARRRRN